jgi:hypothetical protein
MSPVNEWMVDQRTIDNITRVVCQQFGVGSGRHGALDVQEDTVREIVEVALREAKVVS